MEYDRSIEKTETISDEIAEAFYKKKNTNKES